MAGDDDTDQGVDYLKESWTAGERAHFEYHCLESDSSGDAQAWYRSHQQVTVIGQNTPDPACAGLTQAERFAEAVPHTYLVEFDDGHRHDVFEDELMTDPAGFYRPDPPAQVRVIRPAARERQAPGRHS